MTRRRDTDSGFVLVGVVILVLALTILGLSLFNLSSYEGQFLGRSLGSTQALYNAESGAEMVKVVLSASPFRLSDAHQAEGRFGIVRAVAKQQKSGPGGVLFWDSTGTVDPNPARPVWVTVVARQGTSERRMEARYIPGRRPEYYKRLFTTPGTVDISLYSDYPGVPVSERDRCNSVRLWGNIWEMVPTTQNYNSGCVAWDFPHQLLNDSLSVPDVNEFFALHATQPGVRTAQVDTHHGNPQIEMGESNQVTWYVGPNYPATFYESGAGGVLEIDVRGTVVWMLPAGFRSDKLVRIRRDGGGRANLVIVAGPNLVQFPGYGQNAIWFFSGIDSDDDVNLFLVSDANVWIEHVEGWRVDGEARNLSVFAGNIRALGPWPGLGPGHEHLDLAYDTDMDDVVDDLLAQGVLPVPSGSAIRSPFTLVPGSWRDLSP